MSLFNLVACVNLLCVDVLERVYRSKYTRAIIQEHWCCSTCRDIPMASVPSMCRPRVTPRVLVINAYEHMLHMSHIIPGSNYSPAHRQTTHAAPAWSHGTIKRKTLYAMSQLTAKLNKTTQLLVDSNTLYGVSISLISESLTLPPAPTHTRSA